MQRLRIGEVLVEMGFITPIQLEEVLKIQQQSKEKKKLGTMLMDLGIISEEQMLNAMSVKLDLPVANLSEMQIDAEAVQYIPEELARQKNVVAYRKEGNTLFLATNDPLDFYVFEDIKQITHCQLDIVMAKHNEIIDAIEYYYKQQEMYRVASEINIEQDELERMVKDIKEDDELTENSPVVKLLNTILRYAYQNNASDIHIEPHEKKIVIRMRKDGILLSFLELNKNILDSINVRIKILSELNIAEKRIPQDGHFTIMNGQQKLNVRVSFIPTVHGEKSVLRLLNANAEIRSLSTFGMSEANYQKMMKMLHTPHGIIYITGPTGSGKSSTLYMMLERMSKSQINISTIEDPVEKNITNINQMQINETAGLTFEVGLRALLRQDPDVIMVGETRDIETATISARAAITGHLVLSTLHTNDAISTIVRLRDMGLENYMIANALIGSVSQRLLRTICPKCKCEMEVNEQDKKEFSISQKKIYYGSGCPHCQYTGYKGRVAIHEIMIVDEKVEELISQQASTSEILEYLKANQDYMTLKEQAIELVKQGETTVEELRRILVL